MSEFLGPSSPLSDWVGRKAFCISSTGREDTGNAVHSARKDTSLHRTLKKERELRLVTCSCSIILSIVEVLPYFRLVFHHVFCCLTHHVSISYPKRNVSLLDSSRPPLV